MIVRIGDNETKKISAYLVSTKDGTEIDFDSEIGSQLLNEIWEIAPGPYITLTGGELVVCIPEGVEFTDFSQQVSSVIENYLSDIFQEDDQSQGHYREVTFEKLAIRYYLYFYLDTKKSEIIRRIGAIVWGDFLIHELERRGSLDARYVGLIQKELQRSLDVFVKPSG